MGRAVFRAQVSGRAVVILRGEDYAVIRAAARAAAPSECCGLLLGQGGVVHAVLPMVNQSADDDRFEIAPADLFAVHRQARRQGLGVIGHYHSHPNGLGCPSAQDRAAIADPSALWLIAALPDQGRRDVSVTAWYPVDWQGNPDFRPVSLLVLQPRNSRAVKKAQDF